MIEAFLSSWGSAIPKVESGLPIWPVIAVLVLLVMINVAAHKALPSYYLFWTLGGSVVALALGKLDGSSWASMGLAPWTWLTGAIWGAIAVLSIFTVYAIGSRLPHTRGAFQDHDIANLSLPKLLWHSMVELPIGTVLFEEVAFRAVLWAMLARRYGVAWATLMSAVLFGLWHVLPSLDMHLRNDRLSRVGGGGLLARITAVLISVVTTTIGGIIFCILRMGSGSLIAPMGMHWATNGWGYLFARREAARSSSGS
ncbi:MAG: type II CAAX endopeptidase family protein [Candidatus Nanopelagicales bacterium]|nr:type II CAAX endopeptidase family protein [Candidatus Nanopelagicales bacterium]